ncbi:hypothetical protein HNY73_018400 [Argiope bruennichi]|uniref:Uncharacterized protein n=1 Tax=Argiope bruennichi TaxID=94029 RepID=A0A8T0EE42_ARGBR|nr:hypothetical protein HNY73_018400 [Argiope bruennichi]
MRMLWGGAPEVLFCPAYLWVYGWLERCRINNIISHTKIYYESSLLMKFPGPPRRYQSSSNTDPTKRVMPASKANRKVKELETKIKQQNFLSDIFWRQTRHL